jgi:hypothetical protein
LFGVRLSPQKEMRDRPNRTDTTWLTDDQLVLLDVLFGGNASLGLLSRDIFLDMWNLGYVHDLDDASLECNIRWLCEHGVLESQHDGDRTWFQMTRDGGELWSRERCPVWERYCRDRYTTTLRGLTLMSVMAVSPEVRDHFLALWPQHPARRRTTVVADRPLIGWHPFPRVYIGVATYEEPHLRSPFDYTIWAEERRQHWAMLERERSWWRSVPELQRFVARANEPVDGPTDVNQK